MNEKFTPAPWNFWNRQHPDNQEFTVIPPNETDSKGWFSKTVNVGHGETILCDVKAMTTGFFLHDFDQWRANCFLIQAAPDMYEALQWAERELRFHKSIAGADKIKGILEKANPQPVKI